MPPEDIDHTWARADLIRVTAVVTRVSKTFIGIEMPPPHGRHTLPWQGPQLRVGDRVTVAGEPNGGFYRRFRPLVVRVAESGGLMRWLGRGGFTLVAIPQSDRERQVPTPTTPQPWLDTLVRHDLLDAKTVIRPDLYGCDPAGLLLSVHEPRGAIPRGFVHYDHKWGNDTDDLVADLAAIAGHPKRFVLVACDWKTLELRFEVRPLDGRLVEEIVAHEGDPEQIAGRMNVHLAELHAERRIWTWDTGMDRYAFLGRAPHEIAAMRDDGLPVDGLSLAGQPPAASSGSPGETDWSDVVV